MLKIDFYESGVGETIIVTFPDEGLGIIDAHPSSEINSRPDILELVSASSKIHFLCLTHPHADHAIDLVKISQNRNNIESFWHTTPEIAQLAYLSSQYPKYPSAGLFDDMIHDIQKARAECIIDLYTKKELLKKRHLLRNDLEAKTIAGVEIITLGPSEHIYNDFTDGYYNGLKDKKEPNLNQLSAILLLKYGKSSILLGGDALKKNWFDAVQKFSQSGCPHAKIIKVPHHGAKNSYNFSSGKAQTSYLSISNKDSFCVLFAGDSTHPNSEVFQELKVKSKPICLNNGLRKTLSDPLNLLSTNPGIRHVTSSPVCNPQISFECSEDGNVVLKEGACFNCGI